MYSILLALIYLSFISLGLPDALLGSAWPVMRAGMGAPVSFAGIVYMIIAGGTILSSLLSDRVTKRFGAGMVTAVSVLATAAALFGFSAAASFWMLCVLAVPYGLGAGAVDAALNNYVALRCASRHMNWLHCFWGVGASIGPYIMGYCLTGGSGWNEGYRIVGIVQIILALVLFFSLPLWKKQNAGTADDGRGRSPALKLPQIIKIRGVKFILPAFFGYCALESTAGLWASSFLVLQRGINPETAAAYAAFFYMGITGGRFLSGFISDRIGDRNMIRAGICVMILGVFAVWLPGAPDWLCLNGLIIIGLGCAPVYPAIIHATPANFGKENSQAIVGVQMASAYTGSALMPPLFGLIAGNISIALYPAFLLGLAGLMLFMTERLNRAVSLKPEL
ncbi:MAG: MFS transporter [Chitinispirillia bacterium]|nr:MFS transporter [Chitinispirillia bacterium]MCL2242835.1 MFS transporter [Chitinispirillia bacterium]